MSVETVFTNNDSDIVYKNIENRFRETLVRVISDRVKFNFGELDLKSEMFPNRTKINSTWEENREIARHVKEILNSSNLGSNKLKVIFAKCYNEICHGIKHSELTGYFSEYIDFIKGKINCFSDFQKIIVGNLIGIGDEYLVSICDAFEFWNGCTDDQKNMCKDITDEQVYLKYPWINEVLSSKKINSEQRNQVKDAFRLMLHMSESNLEIVKILERLKGNGYSIPLFLRNLTDDGFSIDEIYEKGSLKELNCLFKSDNGIVRIEIELEHIASGNVNGFVVKNLSFKDASGDAIRIDTIDPDKIRMFHELYMHLKKGNEK